jgi:hypothetical protein
VYLNIILMLYIIIQISLHNLRWLEDRMGALKEQGIHLRIFETKIMELESLFCHLNLEGFPEKLNAVLGFFRFLCWSPGINKKK